MNAPRSSRGIRLLLAVAASLVLLVPALPVRAASFVFSNPQVSSTFNQGISFTTQLDASEPPSRVELQLVYPGSIGPFVIVVPNATSGGTSSLHYTLDTSGGGHLMPNSPITYTWVAYPSGGGAPVASTPATYHYEDETQQWRTYQDGIVKIHWVQGPTAFAQRAAAIAVKALATDGALLGIPETQPVDFYIYADDQSFRNALPASARENVGGTLIEEIRTLFAEITPDQLNDSWVQISVTHELTHQVVYDATNNPYRTMPRWLNEGFAVYQSEGDTPSDRSLLASAVSSGDLLPLTALGWQFPTDPVKTSLAYAESVSAVDYVVQTYGKDALVKLLLAYRNGPTDDEAMTAALGQTMASFQDAWYQSIGATAPKQFGPVPAPPGPLPSGWSDPLPSQEAAASPATTAPSSAGAAASTPAPMPSATPVASTDGGNASSADLTLVLLAIVILSAAVLAGIVVAGRRAARS